MRYKNITDQELVLTGIGIVPANGEIELPGILENPNFQLVTDGSVVTESVSDSENSEEGSV